MVNCLRDWIGIKGCTVPEDFSGVYVNQLPGSPLKSIEGIANEDQVTYLGVWSDIQERAQRKFKNRVTSWLKRQYSLKNIRSTVDVGRFIDTSKVTAATGKYRGLSYELKFKSSFQRSDYQSIGVSSVSVFLTNAKTGLALKIVDLDTGDILFSKTFNAAAGWNLVKVEDIFKADRIFIGYDDDSTINAPELPLNSSQSKAAASMFYGVYRGDCEVILRGAYAQTTAQIGNNQSVDIVNGDNTFGVSAVINAVCSFDHFVCANKVLFTTALWYLHGAELMIERQFSGRFNRWTTVDAGKASELEDFFTSEFNKEIDIALDGVKLNVNDGCVVCNAQVTQEECIP